MNNFLILTALSILPGYNGSNPYLIIIHPLNKAISDKISLNEFLKATLPSGVKSGQIVEQNYCHYKILSYVYDLPHKGSRNDLVSLSFAIDKTTNYEAIRMLLSELFQYLTNINALSIDILSSILKTIVEGINNKSQIMLTEGNQFDVALFLHQNQLKL